MNTFVRRILPTLFIAFLLVLLMLGKVLAQKTDLSINPSSGPAGTEIVYSGSGFTPNDPAVILWDDAYFANASINEGGTSNGSFATPGDASPGAHKITLCAPDQGCAESASAFFTVIGTKPPTDTPYIPPKPSDTPYKPPIPSDTPYIPPKPSDTPYKTGSISLKPSSGYPGSNVTVYAISFNHTDYSVDIYWDSEGNSVGKVYLDKSGSGSGGFSVPPDASAGYHTVILCPSCGQPGEERAKATFEVLSAPPPPDKPTFTPSYTPSRTPTKFPGYINTPTFTPSATPTVMVSPLPIIPGVIIPPPVGSYPNIQFPLPRGPGSPTCGSLGVGTNARVINFDDQAAGRLTTQYPEVTFAMDMAYIGIPPVRTHSGTKAVSSFFGDAGSVNHPIQMDFRNPVLAVGMYVGRESPSFSASQAILAVLTGYGLNADGNLTALVENFIELPNTSTPIDRCLLIRAPQGSSIRTVRLEFIDNAGRSIGDRRWMDDLTYLPSNTAVVDAPPTVSITQPFNGSTITSESVYLLANITEDVGISNVSASINGGPLESIGFVRNSTVLTTYQSSYTWPTDRFVIRTTNTIRIVAADTAGQRGEATVSFTYRPNFNTDIAAERVEITQSVQSMDSYVNGSNLVMLYNNRPTLLRLFTHTLSGPSPVLDIGGALCPGHTGSAGCSNPVRPSWSVKVYGSGALSYDSMRHNLPQTLNFIIPMAWLRPNQWMEFTVYANYNRENVDELNYSNNYSEESFFVEAGQTLDMAPIPLTVNGMAPDNLAWQIIDGLYAVYPVSNVRYILSGYTRGYTIAGTLNFAEEGSGCGPAWNNILSTVATIGAMDRYSGYVRYYGMVNNTAIGTGPGGCGIRSGRAAGGLVTRTDLVSSMTIAAEEVGHNHGRKHSSIYKNAANPDTDSPFYYDGVLEEGTMGTDVRIARLYPREFSFDFMSYNDTCCRWASIYTYEALARAINSVGFNPTSSLHLAAPINQTTEIPILIGAGSISPEGVTITRPFFTTTRTNPARDDLPLGSYWMELQDSSGNVLFSRNFGVPGNDNAEPGDTGDFSFVVPTTDNVAAVVFKYKDTEIGRVTASPNGPQVTLLTPNGGEQWGASEEQTITWTGSDPDGDILTYRLEYSPDGGNTWRLLALDTRETSLTINTADLPGGNAAMIRLLASDGLNTSMDIPDGLLTVAAKPPQLYIGNPQEETTLPDGWPVILHAYGTDLEDGPLAPETSFAWSSDRDGQVGDGEWLIASSENMSLGEHVITLTGTDSDGQTSTYTTNITVTAGEAAAVAKHPLPLWLIITAAAVTVAVIALVLVLIFRRKRSNAIS